MSPAIDLIGSDVPAAIGIVRTARKDKTQVGLAKQTSKLLPVQHFVVTFTVPKELRSLLPMHPEVGYDAIFSAGSQTIRTLLKKPKNLGSDKVGFFGVLHTWGRDLKDYHPPVHFVVSAPQLQGTKS